MIDSVTNIETPHRPYTIRTFQDRNTLCLEVWQGKHCKSQYKYPNDDTTDVTIIYNAIMVDIGHTFSKFMSEVEFMNALSQFISSTLKKWYYCS